MTATQPVAAVLEAAAEAPIYVTIGFKCAGREAFDDFWKAIREQYRFAEDIGEGTTQAFAVSMGNMFEEQDVIDAILNSDLDHFEQGEMIAKVACNNDLRALCKEWDVEHPSALRAAATLAREGGEK